MKKGLTYAALSALSVSAVIAAPAPQASAAETAQTGFYDIVKEKFTSVKDFKKLSKTEKQNLFKNKDVFFVSERGVIRALDVITVTNAELPSKLTPIADFQKDYNVNFDEMANPSIDYKQLVLGTWNTSYSGYSIKATFNEDMTSDVVVLGLKNTGTYTINGSEMTLNILSKHVTGEITKVSDDEFTITSASGSVMMFTK